MNKEFVSYNQALALKELGFDEPCFGWFGPTGIFNDWDATDINAPLKQQIFRWAREKHNLISWVYISHNEFFYTIVENGRYVKGVGSHANYDESEDACLNKLIEIVKNK
jgi:hypothetical protein